MTPIIDEDEIFRWWETFKADNPLVEVRLIGTNKTASGYFTDPRTLIDAVRPYTNEYNVYYTINPISDSCYGREQKDQVILKPKNTTQDAEIIGRAWVFIDIDCKRIAGVNATDEEVEYAKKKANQVYRFLLDNGFYKPVVVFSGSGVHLYLKCELANTKENAELVKRFLLALGILFDDDRVTIDSVVFNAGRIARLPGTYSRKGSSRDVNRPQRLCHLVRVPSELKRNDIKLFEKIADLAPKEEPRPGREYNYSNERFNLEEFMAKHGIEVKKTVTIAEGTRYILKQCLFDPNHGSDAMIFQRTSGALQYYCFHNGCRDKTWKDVRDKYEPDRNTRDGYNWKNGYQPRVKQEEVFVPVKETDAIGKKWLNMEDIDYYNAEDEEAIPTGFEKLDRATKGLILGEVTIVSGINSSGKSSWLNQVALNAVQQGYNTAIWSGELVAKKLKNWINLVAAGRNNVEPDKKHDGLYFVPKNITRQIDAWTKDRLMLYNNDYGQKWEQLYADIQEQAEKHGTKLIILDNLMSLDLSGNGDKYDKQKYFITQVTALAKKFNCHIVIIAHPRKVVTFLRKEDISGSADITNLADNVFIVHRVNKDFEKRAEEYLTPDVMMELSGYDNIVEVCKNRSYGAVDFMQGLYFERETRRFLNAAYEYTIYGWQKPLTMEMPELIPNTEF